MGKYLKILMYIVVLCFIYLWLSTVFKSCGKNAVGAITETAENAVDGVSNVANDVSEELFEEGDDFEANSGGDSDEIQYEEIDKALAENEADNIEEEAPQSTTTYNEASSYEEDSFTDSSNDNSTSYSSNSSSGNFMVITGSYLVRSNAENMVDQLRSMGYNDAEIAVFDNSQYNTVVASRFSDYGSAVDASSSLKRKGVDSYVHRKK